MGTIASPSDPVSSVMAKATITARTTDTLMEVANLIAANDVGSVPVIMANELVGVISERDLVRAIADGADLSLGRAADRMSQSVLAVEDSDSIETATHMMLDGGIRHLPVIRGDRLVGMVSIRDVLASYQDCTPTGE